MNTYDLDPETRELVEAALNILASVAEIQATDEGLASVYALANSIADRFGIDSRVATVEETADGKIVVTYSEDDDEDEDDFPTPTGSVH